MRTTYTRCSRQRGLPDLRLAFHPRQGTTHAKPLRIAAPANTALGDFVRLVYRATCVSVPLVRAAMLVRRVFATIMDGVITRGRRRSFLDQGCVDAGRMEGLMVCRKDMRGALRRLGMKLCESLFLRNDR